MNWLIKKFSVSNYLDLCKTQWFLFQLAIQVRDDGGLTGRGQLDVTIDRNLAAPEMTAATMSATVLETIQVGSNVGNPVQATDTDSSVRNIWIIFAVTAIFHINVIILIIGSDRPKQAIWTQFRCCRTQHLIRVYIQCLLLVQQYFKYVSR